MPGARRPNEAGAPAETQKAVTEDGRTSGIRLSKDGSTTLGSIPGNRVFTVGRYRDGHAAVAQMPEHSLRMREMQVQGLACGTTRS